MSVQLPRGGEEVHISTLAKNYFLAEAKAKGIKNSHEYQALLEAIEAKKEKKALKKIFKMFVASRPENSLDELAKMFGKNNPFELKKAQEWAKKFERKGRPAIDKYLGKFQDAKEALLQKPQYLTFRDAKKQLKTEVIGRVKNGETPEQIQAEIITFEHLLADTSVLKKIHYWAQKA